ncbi:GntR family transcriptional regulator [Bosea sp. 685]|uniref:GntR family transcriptional regulator n=1 Tax=Bosea sp. 685 TaxID=3080057 RepID=UPI0028929D70|nr:GntR family transcriptional regulator [Bosea sp. 685]WNJ89603.1 GntR family transcriptional regulator [Bosea sp. 685]
MYDASLLLKIGAHIIANLGLRMQLEIGLGSMISVPLSEQRLLKLVRSEKKTVGRQLEFPSDEVVSEHANLEHPQRRLGLEAVIEAVAQDIYAGRLAPGQWLKQIDLVERYQAKRFDVRRALDKLAEKHLVEHLPNRGYKVYSDSVRRAADIRGVCTILEAAAVDDIIERVSDDDVDTAYALAQRFAIILEHGTPIELSETKLAFHRHLFNLCANKELVRLIFEWRGRFAPTLVSECPDRMQNEKINIEHFAIVDALGARDSKRLRELVSSHTPLRVL